MEFIVWVETRLGGQRLEIREGRESGARSDRNRSRGSGSYPRRR
jgi:hypothetical protein